MQLVLTFHLQHLFLNGGCPSDHPAVLCMHVCNRVGRGNVGDERGGGDRGGGQSKTLDITGKLCSKIFHICYSCASHRPLRHIILPMKVTLLSLFSRKDLTGTAAAGILLK